MCRVDRFKGGLVILVALRKEHRQLDIAFFPSRTMRTWDDQSLDHDASRRGLSPNNWGSTAEKSAITLVQYGELSKLETSQNVMLPYPELW